MTAIIRRYIDNNQDDCCDERIPEQSKVAWWWSEIEIDDKQHNRVETVDEE